MALADEISDGSRIAFDTNTIIYFVEENPTFLPLVQPVFAMVAEGRANAQVSAVCLAEVLVRPLRQNRPDLVQRYSELLTESQNLRLLGLDAAIAERAASIRARHRLGLPDAILAASALESEANHLLTNDPALQAGRWSACADYQRILMKES